MTKVMLVEDHTDFRQLVALLFNREPEFEVIAQAGTLAEAREALTEDIDLAVVDLGLPNGSGIEFLKNLRELNPGVVSLVLTTSIDPEEKGRAVEAGATEVLDKSDAVGQVVAAARRFKAE